MPNCPKCGAKVTERMNFCAKCGASLKPAPPPEPTAAPVPPTPAQAPAPSRPEKYEKQEKGEKREKAEKTEKHEKHEKGEYGYVGPIIGGIILIALGLFSYLMMTITVDPGMIGAYFLIAVGIVIILAGIYAALTVARRHPPT